MLKILRVIYFSNVIQYCYHTKRSIVSYNWQHRTYKKNYIFYNERILMPWLQITKDVLWWCGGKNLVGIERRDQLTQENRDESRFSHNNPSVSEDISKFVLWDNFIISGHSDGSIIYWSDTLCTTRPRFLTSVNNVHPSFYIYAIDATSRNVISVSCNMIKVRFK
ncbi:hypothetical protein X777_07375 [Ooceraea biroi]|uniref:Uncharacterized protein n=1 Tax=Ooceraea biroi TaxID=2015173 RepID=A0A026WBN4_OOCBI|nr:hypothetical protein X777_07375 [Ooceraea biroi]